MDGAFRFDVLATLEELAAQRPDWPANITQDRSVSFAELFERVKSWVVLLQDNGVSPGHRVALTLPDEMLHLEVSWAIAACGAASFCLASFRTQDQRARMAETAAVDFHLIADPIFGVKSAKNVIIREDLRPTTHGPVSGHAFDDSNAEFLLFSTSGTTAAPKIFARKVGQLGPAVRAARISFDEMYAQHQEQCILLRGGSVEYDNHRISRFNQVLSGGANSIMQPFTPVGISEFCDATGVTVLSIGGYWLQAWLSDPNATRLSDKVLLSVGGAPVPRDQRRAVLEQITETFHLNYATSELGVISTALPDDHLKAENCIGLPNPGYQVSLRDAQGHEVEQGQTGTAWVRTTSGLQDYISGETGANSDGWFCTGDVLSVLPDGCLEFHGRRDDMFLMNGINIFPAAIEKCLLALPYVDEAVAYGIPSPQHGHIPAASVVLTTDGTAATQAEILKHCRHDLGLQFPRRLDIRDSIPKNEQGKPLRRVLIDEVSL